MAKTKPNRVKLNKRHSLEGTPYDWRLITHGTAVNEKGETVHTEKFSYFPRLHQVAECIVSNEAKSATSLRELIDTIQTSTNSIIKMLGSKDIDVNADFFADIPKTEGEDIDHAPKETKKRAARSKAKPEPVKEEQSTGRTRRRRKTRS